MIGEYRGHLIAANPANPDDEDKNAVIFMITHNQDIALGLRIDRMIYDYDLAHVCGQSGLEYVQSDPVFYGGKHGANRIHVIHSLDWSGVGTLRISDELGVTNDVSILYAISEDEGPEHYRACAGHYLWNHGTFNEQIDPKNYPSRDLHRWEAIPATYESIFNFEGVEQWKHVLKESAKFQAHLWF